MPNHRRRSRIRINRQSLPALGFILIGILLMGMPFLVSHAGYSSKILVASDHLKPPFDKSLILVSRDTVDGAFGLILNKPLSAAEHNQLSPFLRDSGVPIFYGGPLQATERVFILEQRPSGKAGEPPDIDITDWDVAVRDTPDILTKIRTSLQNGEKRYRLFTGYVAWTPFQLEAEVLLKNRWRPLAYTFDLVFQNGDAFTWDGLQPKEKPRPSLGPNQT